jgi:hypothetical protein
MKKSIGFIWNVMDRDWYQAAAEPQAWQCEVQMEMSVPNGGFRSSKVLLRIARSGEGRVASRLR